MTSHCLRHASLYHVLRELRVRGGEIRLNLPRRQKSERYTHYSGLLLRLFASSEVFAR